ncbi:hypothetical protein EX895_001847 [Sporisorium graminicola]|uniref:DNA endonuclease activator Ctp1 C-terminal domain-containing protein n=1 Tax=Sporisorium graminicola TaxID=280036 RepID=A0A4U7KYA3_9BASI|nr:hypothetical protein EX895_001847 [Sporisorium graminicola]TKY89316.1 hypothetical protein EX895_001847 [Sporisorium graminicola]
MSGNLKRKRAGGHDGGAGAPISVCPTHSTTSTQPGSGGGAGGDAGQPLASPETNTFLIRTHLEQSLSELYASTSRIEALLHLLPPCPQASSSRSALAELHAPAQPAQPSHPCSSLAAKPPAVAAAQPPSQCCECSAALQTELTSLRTQVARHARERDAWKAFKAWWLDSLAKRERRRSRHRRRDGHDTEGGSGDGELARIVGKLDAQTKRVWVDAGVLAEHWEGCARETQTEHQVQEEQSELTLPVHPASKVTASGSNGGRGMQKGVADSDVDAPPAACDPADASSAPSESGPPPSSQRHKFEAVDRAGAAGAARKTGLAPTMAAANPAASTSRGAQTHASKRDAHPTGDVLEAPQDHEQRHPPTTLASRTTTAAAAAPAASPYIDTTPIRNRLTRRTLHASDCPDCTLFYTHLDCAATAAGSTSTSTSPHQQQQQQQQHGGAVRGGAGGWREGDVSRQACSRHRTTFARAPTPDGYWNIAFPSTQEADAINAGARSRRSR